MTTRVICNTWLEKGTSDSFQNTLSGYIFTRRKTMTLPEVCKMADPLPKSKSMNIGEAIKETIVQALGDDRLVIGVFSCANLLEISPETVMVCILPESSKTSADVSVHIQQTLVEAYCVEHDIPILKIGNSEKLANTLTHQVDDANNNTPEARALDLSCLLIQNPKKKSSTDNFVVDFCEMIFVPQPKIELPG